MSCFSSEPLVTADSVYLGCSDIEGNFMAQWSGKFKNLIRAEEGRIFSHPLTSQGKVSWYEFDMAGVRNLFEVQEEKVQVTAIKNIGYADSFVPLSFNSWIYRSSEEGPQLWMWTEGKPSPLFTEEVAHIFPPYVDDKGGMAIKTRDLNTSESSPDKLWAGKNELKMILEDRDANPSSPYKAFRHQLAVSEGRVAVVATDDKGEVLLLLQDGSIKEVARAGKDVKSFDYFSPKMRGETLVFRGVDFENRKALWVYKRGELSRLVTQGDVVHTDLGAARIHYHNQDSIFYGAPGIGPQGEIVQQATLTDLEHPTTLLGIGLIKFIDR